MDEKGDCKFEVSFTSFTIISLSFPFLETAELFIATRSSSLGWTLMIS